MSKISAFLKAKKSTKKNEVVEPAPETATKVETAVAGKEEWTKDVVDVEIVPVAVRKVDGASDFEDEEIELPSSMVKLNFEWGRSAEERKANAGKQQSEAADAEQSKQQASGLGMLFALKTRKKAVEEWTTLEAAGAMGKSTTANAATAAPEANVLIKKRKERRKKQFLLSSAKEGDDKIITLSSKDIWAVIEPWQRPTFLQSSA